MQVPVYGTSAYKLDNSTPIAPAREKVQKVRVQKQKKNKTAMRGMILFVAAIIVAFGILLTNSQIMEQNSRVAELENKLEMVNAQVVAGQFAIERGMDLGKVEDEAMHRLGMQRPSKAQTVYIDLGNHDYAETAAPRIEKKGILTMLADNLMEYFG